MYRCVCVFVYVCVCVCDFYTIKLAILKFEWY